MDANLSFYPNLESDIKRQGNAYKITTDHPIQKKRYKPNMI
jgi:hypothetical protein